MSDETLIETTLIDKDENTISFFIAGEQAPYGDGQCLAMNAVETIGYYFFSEDDVKELIAILKEYQKISSDSGFKHF